MKKIATFFSNFANGNNQIILRLIIIKKKRKFMFAFVVGVIEILRK